MSPNVRVFNVLARLNLDSESDSILEAVLGENKNPLERVKDLLDIYGRCKLREGYWVSIFEALLTAQHAHARAIASSLCEELNLRRFTETIAIYPLVICGILNAGNRLDPLSSSGPGNRDWFCPSIIGRMFRHYAEGATTMHPTCSEDVKRQLSEAFLEYIRGVVGILDVECCRVGAGVNESGYFNFTSILPREFDLNYWPFDDTATRIQEWSATVPEDCCIFDFHLTPTTIGA